MKAWRTLLGLLRRRSLETDMATELQGYIDELTERNIAAGMTPDEARYAARREFGGVEQIKERAREARGWLWVDQFVQDFGFSMRQMRRNPSFSATAIATLSLGVAANVVAFSLVNVLFFHPLPGVTEPSQIADITATGIDYPEFEFFRDHARSFDAVAASTTTEGRVILTERRETAGAPIRDSEYVPAVGLVSGNYFTTLGVPIHLGRGFLPQGDRAPGGNPVLVLSYAYWQSRFHGDPAVIGKVVLLNEVAFTVIGVASSEFLLEPVQFIDTQLWAPISMAGVLDPGRVDPRLPRPSVHVFTRLAEGVTRESAAAELSVLESQYLDSIHSTERHKRSWSELLGRGFAWAPWQMADVRWTTLLLLMLSAAVLVVACANLANLLLARATTRQREISVRLAMGASRRRIVRQLLTESTVLGCIGGALGLVLATWMSDLLWPRLLHLNLSQPLLRMFGLDYRIALYAIGISVVTGILFGLVPALEASKASIHTGLKQETSVLGRRFSRTRLRNALIILQIAVSVVLLIASSLLMRAVANRPAPENSFETDHLFFVDCAAQKGSAAAEKSGAEQQALLERIRAMPGVVGACLGDVWEGRPPRGRTITIDGAPQRMGPKAFSVVMPDYFKVAGLDVRQGRVFSADDWRGAAAIAVVSETFATRYWPGQVALGHTLQWDDHPAVEIVGVVKDGVETARLWPNVRDGGDVYLLIGPTEHRLHEIWVRTSTDPMPIMRAIADQPRLRQTLLEVGPRGPMRLMLAERQQMLKLVSSVVAALGGLALLLAAMGVYGVMMYVVAQRTREFGIRMALGASPRQILRSTLWDGARLVGWGVVLGGSSAIALATLARTWAMGVSPVDPPTLVAVSGLLAWVALLACWVPARQATRVDPMVALRCD